jgi:putative hemolysin
MKANGLRPLIVYVIKLAHASILSATTTGIDLESLGLANPASVYCHEQGGTLEIKSDRDGNQYGLCHLSDGSVCEEWALFRDNICVSLKESDASLSD